MGMVRPTVLLESPSQSEGWKVIAEPVVQHTIAIIEAVK